MESYCNPLNNTPATVMAQRNISYTKLFSLGLPRSVKLSHTRRRAQSLTLPIAACVFPPHEPTSHEGKQLNYVLQKKRYFFQSGVSEKLNELASVREEEVAVSIISSASMESSFQRRITEIKQKDRQTAVEDLMYLSTVHKFLELEIPMVPRLPECMINNNTVGYLPSRRRELVSVHKVETQKLIREHLVTVLPHIDFSRITKGHLGRIYAASTRYGYFLKSASFRRNMELSLVCSMDGFGSIAEAYSHHPRNVAALGQCTDARVTLLYPELKRFDRLSNYIKGFDSECLHRCSKLKSSEAVNVIKRHTWALFGDDNILELGCHGAVLIPSSSVERLILEAIAFGSFLWDAERSVDSIYTLQIN